MIIWMAWCLLPRMHRRQCNAQANVLLGNCGSCSHVDVTLTYTTYIDQVHPQYYIMAVAFRNRIMCRATV